MVSTILSPRLLPVLLGLSLFGSSSFAESFDHSHSAWNSLVGEFVREGLVDYVGLSKNTSGLDLYLLELDSVSMTEVDSWSKEKQLAFWINAYNAFTVRAILDFYPIRTWTLKGLVVPRNSIIQIPGVWKKLTWEVAGQSLTLDHIEHGLIRPRFHEPRIHFAIVCASIGCPDLRSEAYTFEKLETQLDEQTRSYLFDENKGVKLDFVRRKVSLSQLFSWFSEDFEIDPPEGFEAKGQSDKILRALRYISYYHTDPETRALFQSRATDFDFLAYDWSLNELKSSDEPVF